MKTRLPLPLYGLDVRSAPPGNTCPSLCCAGAHDAQKLLCSELSGRALPEGLSYGLFSVGHRLCVLPACTPFHLGIDRRPCSVYPTTLVAQVLPLFRLCMLGSAD